MKFRSFMRPGTNEVIAVNMDLVEMIWANSRGSTLSFRMNPDGTANKCDVTDDFTELTKSLRT